MECAAKGSGTACCGPPVRRCERCHAVAYCSLSHQVLHSSVHKSECKRLEQQMKRADILNEFPFTFTRGATQIQETGCSFLTRHGIHRLGMWMCECSCGVLANSSDDLRLINSWNLPSELCPCKGPSSPILDRLATWKDYHEWRGIPLNSPAALLLHWPLTIYWAIQLATLESLLPEISNELRIHYLGPEKELLQLAVFGELQALFPGVKVHIDFVGPSVSRLRDGEKVELYTYAQCNNMECECKYSVEDHGDTTKTCQSCPITLRLHAGYYHDCYRKSLKGSPPHIIIAPNAGVGAYTSWLPTLELIKELKVAAVFSDYCEEASQLATRCISSVTGTSPKIQMQINPFRHPLAIEGRLGFEFGDALKVPFRVKDMLPVLPRQVSWPVLNNIHSAVDLMPQYIGSLAPYNGTVTWKGACFFENEAKIEFTGAGDRGIGGGVIHLLTAAAHSWTCMDLYVFATPYRVTWDYYFSSRDHTLKIESWEEPAEVEYVKQHGISVFLMPSGMLGTFLSLVDVLPLFSNTGWGQSANLAFLEKHMGATFEKRSQPWRATINPEDVHSGDFLAVSKIRGRWGGFETLEKWVTGAFAGHTAVCLKDELGNLWVGESGHENEKGEEIIALIPWEEWWEETLKDSSNPQIALLPLHPDVRTRFNNTAAWEYARQMAGKPYGYHNMIFSWIDTVADNYPPPLDAHLVISVMSMWTRMQPAYAANMWNEALNMRLGTEDLDLYEIIAETERRGITFDQLLTIPEQDEWVYSDGKSTTCVAFILAMYKAARVFHPISDSIQVTEFTIRDAYMLKIFESNTTRLPSWCNNEEDRLPFCQILGEYKMELPYYNTLEPYANMNENCPSLPPVYERPARC